MRALLVLLAVTATPAAQLGLEEVLTRAIERAPESLVARGAIEIARAELKTAEMIPNPSLGLSGARSEPKVSGGIAFRLPFLGQKQALERAAEHGVSQAEAESLLALWHLRHDARLAYYAAVRAKDELAIAEQVEALTRRVSGMAGERFAVGAGNLLEKEQAALVHVRAEQDVSDRSAAARIAAYALARVIVAENDTLAPFKDGLASVGPTPSIEKLLAEAEAAHPEIAALTRARDAANARAALGRADRVPVPTVELGAELLEAQTCGAANGTRCVSPRGALSFDLPVLNQNAGPIARAEAEAALEDAKIKAATRRIETAIRAAYAAFDAATRRARFFDERYVPAADRVEGMAREGFSEGRTGLLPLLEAERSVLDARLGRAGAWYEVQAARADLEESSGVSLSAP